MTPAAIEEFFGRCRHAVVAVRGDDGFPLPAVARVDHAPGTMTLTLAAHDAVAEALAAGAEACCVADEWPQYDDTKGVIAHGVATEAQREGPATRIRFAIARMATFDFGRRA